MGVSINPGPLSRHATPTKRATRARAADVVHRAVYRRIRKMYDHLSGFGPCSLWAGRLPDHEEDREGHDALRGAKSIRDSRNCRRVGGGWPSPDRRSFRDPRPRFRTRSHGHQHKARADTVLPLRLESRRQPDAASRTPARSAWPPRSPCTSSSSARTAGAGRR